MSSDSEVDVIEEADASLDDIFAKLSKVQKTSSKKGETFEDLQAEVKSMPGLSKVDLSSEKEKERKKRYEISSINDPVESVLPGSKETSNDKTAWKRRITAEWFEIPKAEVTPEMKKELSIIKYRQYLDPKKFYKKDRWEIPERFQMGTIVGGPLDYHNRLTRKQRGKGFVEELLHDDKANKYFKKTYDDIQVERRSGGKRYYKDKVSKRKKRS